MQKKIYDIISPNSRIVQQPKTEECCVPRKKKGNGGVFIWIIAILVILFGGAYFLFPGKAIVSISPQTEDITAEAQITVDSNAGIIDYTENVIPGVVFTGDSGKTYTATYPATGTGDNTKKATGTIRVYNKIKPAESLSLIKGTRFISATGGLTYRADSAFTIPAMKDDGTPGSVDIKVTADEAGEQYNIKSETFSVPGLSGTSYYLSVSAEVIGTGGISGGEDSTVKLVSKNDLSSSKDKFEMQYSDEAKNALIAKIPSGFEYSSDDIVPVLNNLVVSAKENDQVDNFTISAQVETNVLVYRTDDMDKLGESLLKQNLSDLKTIVPGSITYTIKSKTAAADGKKKMTIDFAAKTYSMPDSSLLMGSLKGKDPAYSVSVLENMPEIKKVEIKLTPFWQFKVPADDKRISVKTVFE